MKVKCVYRWITDAEIIEGMYDTDTGLIDNVPYEMFHLSPATFKYHEANYNVYGAVPYEKLHAALNRGNNLYAVIDFDGIGIVQVLKDYALRYLFIDEYLPDVAIDPVFEHRYCEIGRAKTIVRQNSVMTKPQVLYFDATHEVIHTCRGDLTLDFPITELESVMTFDRYVEMSKDDNAIGVVRYNGYNKLLIRENNIARKE